MNTITYSKARATLAETMHRVCEDHTPTIITRGADEAVVMISLEDYKAMEETTYLLRNPINALRLMDSIAELEGGRGRAQELVE